MERTSKYNNSYLVGHTFSNQSEDVADDESVENKNISEPNTSFVRRLNPQIAAKNAVRERASFEELIHRTNEPPKFSAYSQGRKLLGSHAFSSISDFLTNEEVIKLQQLNKFCYNTVAPRLLPQVEIRPNIKLNNGGIYNGKYRCENNNVIPFGNGKLVFADTSASHGIKVIEGTFYYHDNMNPKPYYDPITDRDIFPDPWPNTIDIEDCKIISDSDKEYKVFRVTLDEKPNDPMNTIGLVSILNSNRSSLSDINIGSTWEEDLKKLQAKSISAESSQVKQRNIFQRLTSCIPWQNRRN